MHFSTLSVLIRSTSFPALPAVSPPVAHQQSLCKLFIVVANSSITKDHSVLHNLLADPMAYHIIHTALQRQQIASQGHVPALETTKCCISKTKGVTHIKPQQVFVDNNKHRPHPQTRSRDP